MLGPVSVLRDGVVVDVGGTRAETLLALLALRAGSPVSADTLVDELWGGEPPDGAFTTLRSYVSRLRAVLGDAAPIERQPAGYALQVPSAAVDAAQFEVLARDGLKLLEQGRHRRAADLLRRALELWRGTPFAGLPEDGVLRVEAVRLQELRVAALEARVEAELAVGRAAELVDELETAVVAHPFRERLWRHLMLALYRAGRQADALAAYHRARQALDEQLGLEPGAELRDLEAAILRHDVPSPARARQAKLAVPVPLTTFIGRERELQEVRGLLWRSRLVTLVGVGGVGKTRLAIEAARQASEDMVDAAAFVDLAPLADPILVPGMVAASLGIPESDAHQLAAGVAERAAGADLLLVLDNCEHLRDATADLAQSLLAAAPTLRILATSREILDVAGEATYAVPPLAVPGDGSNPDTARASEAVRLLVDRATLTRHDLRVDDQAYATAARICRELDGLPLAIELAAARAKALSLEEIASRLRDRFQFLVSWRRLSAARHRTLREAMDWSFELLALEEQQLLARFSIFPAGATLSSIAAVCLGGDEALAERLVERLVDASLVVPVDHETGTRYRLLETVRQYAADRVPADELDVLRRRHAERLRTIAESTNLCLEGTGSVMSFDVARAELPSIRAAIRSSIGVDPSLGLGIACSLERLWTAVAPREGVAIFTELLAQEGISELDRARGLRCRGGSRYVFGDFAAGTADYEAALEIHRRLGQPRYIAHLLLRLAIEAQRAGDVSRARELHAEVEREGRDDRFVVDRYVALGLLADLEFAQGRTDESVALLRRESDLAAEYGDTWWQMNAELRLAERAFDAGRLDLAGAAARASLRLARRTTSRLDAIWSIALLSREAAATGNTSRAGRLWGGLEAEVERGGRVGQWEDEAEGIRATVAALAGDGFEAEVAASRSIALEEVVEEALRER